VKVGRHASGSHFIRLEPRAKRGSSFAWRRQCPSPCSERKILIGLSPCGLIGSPRPALIAASDRCERIAAASINPTALLDELRKAVAVLSDDQLSEPAPIKGAPGAAAGRKADFLPSAIFSSLDVRIRCRAPWMELVVSLTRRAPFLRFGAMHPPSLRTSYGYRNVIR
jgi:hypothetical protein